MPMDKIFKLWFVPFKTSNGNFQTSYDGPFTAVWLQHGIIVNISRIWWDVLHEHGMLLNFIPRPDPVIDPITAPLIFSPHGAIVVHEDYLVRQLFRSIGRRRRLRHGEKNVAFGTVF